VRGIETKEWTCVRQRAGPLVKEVRYRRPQLRPGDLPGVRREKNEIVRAIRNSCFRRTPADRLELMLALMGWRATTYVLTFSDETLPDSFAGVRACWARFAKDMRRARGGAFDYVYVIEGLHGGKRWHIHCVLRDGDFTEADVRRWWSGGLVLDPEPLMQGPGDKFRRTAEYFTKERRDGVKIPAGKRTWVAAPSLYRALPPPEKKRVKSGTIRLPRGALWNESGTRSNAFGDFRYRKWILPPP
jgi:hypothetical protein